MAKHTFVMYKSWDSAIQSMTDDQAGKLLKAIYDYQLGREKGATDPAVVPILALMSTKFDEDAESYEQVCAARAEAGRKGGAAKASNAKQMLANASSAKQSLASRSKAYQNVPESESESVSDSVSESVSASEKEKRGAAHSAYDPDPEVNSAIKDFVDQRKKMRKPMTDRAIQLFQNRLESLSKGDKALKIQMIDTAIERGWQTVYPPKEEKRGSTYVEAIRNRYDGIDEWAQGGETYDESGV